MEPKFITVFTRARHWTLSWVRWLHSTSSHLVFKIRFVSILHLCQCFPSGHLRRHVWLGLCMHFLYPPCVLHILPISCSFLLISIIFGEAYNLWNTSLCSLLQPPATPSFLGPHILLSALFSNTLSLRGCIQKFPDWPPGARTANGKTLLH
jgi:hypothetical protein